MTPQCRMDSLLWEIVSDIESEKYGRLYIFYDAKIRIIFLIVLTIYSIFFAVNDNLIPNAVCNVTNYYTCGPPPDIKP